MPVRLTVMVFILAVVDCMVVVFLATKGWGEGMASYAGLLGGLTSQASARATGAGAW